MKPTEMRLSIVEVRSTPSTVKRPTAWFASAAGMPSLPWWIPAIPAGMPATC